MTTPALPNSKRIRMVTAEMVEALNTVDEARRLTALLLRVKSTHPWTDFECNVLAALCKLLGVPIP